MLLVKTFLVTLQTISGEQNNRAICQMSMPFLLRRIVMSMVSEEESINKKYIYGFQHTACNISGSTP